MDLTVLLKNVYLAKQGDESLDTRTRLCGPFQLEIAIALSGTSHLLLHFETMLGQRNVLLGATSKQSIKQNMAQTQITCNFVVKSF